MIFLVYVKKHLAYIFRPGVFGYLADFLKAKSFNNKNVTGIPIIAARE